jgi:hypothetical protein
MREIVRWRNEEIAPGKQAVYLSMGIADPAKATPRTESLFNQAQKLFLELAEARAVVTGLSREEFAAVFSGEGENAPHAPLQHIFPRADSLALYGFTLGERISERISVLFASGQSGLAAVLDAVASCAADLSSHQAEAFFLHKADQGGKKAKQEVLLYSPGYCGWHISGQRKLFASLRPDDIGLRLNESCLMIPLKSISGVLVLGHGDIHHFAPNFSFCSSCRAIYCRHR